MAPQRSARTKQKVGTASTSAKSGVSRAGKAAAPRKGKAAASMGKASAKRTAAKPEARSKPKARSGEDDVLKRLRKICAAWPETSEKEAWGTPTFRVRDKMFAMYADNHHNDGRTAVWCKAGLGVQEALVATDPTSFFVPPYVGVKGWLGVRLDVDVDWDEVGDILADAYQMTAPAKLAAALGPKAK